MKHCRLSGRRLRSLGALLALLLAGLPVGNDAAQNKFPSQALELIVTFGPGGGADGMARTLTPILERILGYPMMVSNVAGGSGNVGLTKLLNNPPDGYTMATLSSAGWATGVGFASIDDFAIVAVTQDTPSMLFVAADSQFKSFKELLEYAKANPGKLRVGTAGVGTQDDVTLKHLAFLGYVMQNSPFAIAEARYTALLGKRTDVLYEEPGDVLEYVDSKKYRPLVVFADERMKAFPEVPTAKELGLDISGLTQFRMLVVPAKTPPERVRVLAQALDQALQTPKWREYCQATYSCAGRHTPEEAKAKAAAFVKKINFYLKPAR